MPALAIGVYLLVTTVVIAQDGLQYIRWARSPTLLSDIGSITHPAGYPLLIRTFHSLFRSGPSNLSWIHTAQAVSLLFRVLAVVPLFYLGKMLFDSRSSFWALFLLTFLPLPAEYGSDVLREWPALFFLAVGFLMLVAGAGGAKTRLFAMAGVATGLGQIIRPEVVQIMLYALLWIIIQFCIGEGRVQRHRLFWALTALFFGYCVVMLPYGMAGGRAIPGKIQQIQKQLTGDFAKGAGGYYNLKQDGYVAQAQNLRVSGITDSTLIYAVPQFIKKYFAIMMYYYIPFFVLGAWQRLWVRRESGQTERILMTAFFVVNVVMLCFVYGRFGVLSKRHCLPLVAFSFFYVWQGLRFVAEWFAKNRPAAESINLSKRRTYFLIFAITGVGICLPKLLEPIRFDKRGFRWAAVWLRDHTAKKDVIAVPDERITFYAGRSGLSYSGGDVPQFAGCLDCGEDISLNETGRITIFLRVKFRQVNRLQFLLSRRRDVNNRCEIFVTPYNTFKFVLGAGDRFASVSSKIRVRPDVWYVVTGAFDTQHLSLTVNGVETSVTLHDFLMEPADSERLFLGARRGPVHCLHGCLAEAYLFNRLFAGQQPFPSLQNPTRPGLIAGWNMEHVVGDVVWGCGESGQNARMVGGRVVQEDGEQIVCIEGAPILVVRVVDGGWENKRFAVRTTPKKIEFTQWLNRKKQKQIVAYWQ